MKKIIISVFLVLLGLGVIRYLMGERPLGLSGLLDALSRVDISFNDTLESVTALKDSITFPVLSNLNVLEAIGEFFKWLYTIIVNAIKIPTMLIVDALEFLYSVFEFFYILLGGNFSPTYEDKFGIFGSGGFGGGAGGAR